MIFCNVCDILDKNMRLLARECCRAHRCHVMPFSIDGLVYAKREASWDLSLIFKTQVKRKHNASSHPQH